MVTNASNVGLAAILIGISVFLIMYAIFAPRKSSGIVGRTLPVAGSDDGFNRYVRPMLRNFIPQTPLSAAAQNMGSDKIELLLIRSGNPWKIRPEEFLGIQVLFAAIGLFGGILMAAFSPIAAVPGIVWMLGFPLAGYLIPYSYHNTLKENRSKEVQKQLPEALDLLVITLASGQNFEPALSQVAPTLPNGLLKEEIIKVNYELAAGRGIEASLLDFARRASSDEVEAFAKAVSQAQRLGSDVSETLVNQATSARAAYESRIEKKISRLSSIMMVPLVFTMIPSLMLIILAPTMSQLTTGMGM
jgi:tight adherence protein C